MMICCHAAVHKGAIFIGDRPHTVSFFPPPNVVMSLFVAGESSEWDVAPANLGEWKKSGCSVFLCFFLLFPPAIFQLEESCVECSSRMRGGGWLGTGAFLTFFLQHNKPLLKVLGPYGTPVYGTLYLVNTHHSAYTLSLCLCFSKVAVQILCTKKKKKKIHIVWLLNVHGETQVLAHHQLSTERAHNMEPCQNGAMHHRPDLIANA